MKKDSFIYNFLIILLIFFIGSNSFLIIFAFFIIVSIFNSHSIIYPYLIIGFWTIILHTCQMMFAKILIIKGGLKNVS